MSKRHYIIPIFVPHEGCPHDCVFCNQGRITGESLKKVSLVKDESKVDAQFVRKTIEEYLETINKTNSTIEVSFFGGTFTAIPLEKQKELLQVAREYKESGIISFIRLSTRPDYINREILDHLKEYTVDIIELGVQSLDEEVLLRSGRGHGVNCVEEASKLILEYGFTLGHQIMLGLPYDTFEKDIYTVKRSIEMKPNICRIYPALVIKDTPMEDMYKQGIYKPYTLNEATRIATLLYAMYEDAGVNIIRVGLQPTDNINHGGDIIAGPFHAAFRELIEGNIFNKCVLDNIDVDDKEVGIRIHSKDISKLYTNKKDIFNDTLKKLKGCKVEVKVDDKIERSHIVFIKNEKSINVSIESYLKSKLKEGKSLLI